MKHRIPSPRKAAKGALRPEGVALAFARDRDGALVAAAALDEASRRDRAPFRCPGCGDALTPKLGPVRARHFAHQPGSRCPLTSPETALHFNAKTRLLSLCEAAFAGELTVTLRTRCPACRRLDARPLAGLGDGAVEEGAIGALRADVLVTRHRRPALALEVLVTHAVDAAKAAALEGAGVPVVEIDAREEWEREGSGPEPAARSGTRAPPPVEVEVHRALGFPACASCQAQARADGDRALGGEAAQIAELEAYRARGLLVAEPHGRRRAGDPQLTPAELTGLRSRFRCPECASVSLLVGSRLVRHPCPAQGDRPVAWRGYDGRVAELGWWKR